MSGDAPSCVMVTGAQGWVGAAVVRALLAQGHAVLALSRSPGPQCTQHPRLQWLGLAQLDGFLAMQPALRLGALVHCAGHAHAEDGPLPPQQALALYRSANVELTQRVLGFAWALGCRRVVFLSSIKVYGEATPRGGLPWTAPCVPTTAYGISKLEAERLVESHVALHGGLARVLRLSMVYDFAPDGLPSKGNLRKLAAGIRRGLLPPLPENGNVRALVHLDAVVQAVLDSALEPLPTGPSDPNFTVQVLAEPPISTASLCDALRLRYGRAPARWRVPAWVLWSAAAMGSALNACLRRLRVPPLSPIHLPMMQKLLGSQYIAPEKTAPPRLGG